MDGVEPALVHEDGYFRAAAFGQVGDQLGVGDVAVEEEGFAALEGIDDVGDELRLALQADGLVTGQPLLDVIAPGLLGHQVFLQDVGILTRVPAGAMGAVLLDQVWALAEPPVVLEVVPARLGDVVVQVQEQLVVHDFFVVYIGPAR
jgi:hypothetical protein